MKMCLAAVLREVDWGGGRVEDSPRMQCLSLGE